MEYRIISGDGHVDLNWLPHDVFVDNAPSQWKHQMPHVEDSTSGPVWKANGKIMTPVGVFRAESWTNPAGFYRERRLEEVGFSEDSERASTTPRTPSCGSRTRTWTA